MNYAFRFYVNDRLEDSADTPDLVEALSRFRATLVVANNVMAETGDRFFAVVNAEAGPYPEQSYTVASYQQPGRGHAVS